MPEQLDVGYWPVVPAFNQSYPQMIRLFRDGRWFDYDVGDGAPQDRYIVVGPRLIEPSEIAEFAKEMRVILDGMCPGGNNTERLRQLLDALCPALSIECGKWYWSCVSQFRMPLKIDGERITNLSIDGDEIRVQVNSADRFKRRATPEEVTQIKKVVNLGE